MLIGALFRYFQGIDETSLSNKAFVTFFGKLHRAEWERCRKERLEHDRERQSRWISEKKGQLDRNERDRERLIVFNTTDEASFLRKLAEAASKYRSNTSGYANGLRSFRDSDLSPESFRDAFNLAFSISLTLRECGVLLGALNVSGSVNGKRFLSAFHKLCREMATRSDLSDVEIMGLLRSEDLTKPLSVSYNDSAKHRTVHREYKTFDALDTMNRANIQSRSRERSAPSRNSTPERPDPDNLIKLSPLPTEASSSIFLMKANKLRNKKLHQKKPSSLESPLHKEQNASLPTKVRPKKTSVVFPALLSSAPLFSLSSGMLLRNLEDTVAST
jgi:hypothetical protein